MHSGSREKTETLRACPLVFYFLQWARALWTRVREESSRESSGVSNTENILIMNHTVVA